MIQGIAAERWRQLRPLLDRALDLQGAERARFLNEISAESREQREQLERLLARHEDTALVDQPAAALVEVPALTDGEIRFSDRNIGRRIGAYRLNALLGRGGMGAVYAAERVDGAFQQQVAIKLMAGVHPGLSARFQRERQILAELRHPHIAQLIDGGETDDGMPYFALEYVQGMHIGVWVEQHQNDLRACLKLLLEVAQALDYAHRQGVIHRDIKPGNIMVTDEGHAKLLDFGIARLHAAPGETLTVAGLGPMTPDYAAPEQFQGGALGPATDIYQFGVLMFRLLGGRLPYDASPDNALAWAKAVSQERPLDLARLLQARQRSADPGLASAPTAPALWRQLQAICAQALAKEQRHRQASMGVVVSQLQACLEGQSALPGGNRQSRRRWLQIALAVLALVGFGGVISWQWLPGPAAPSPNIQGQLALDGFGLELADLHSESPVGAEMLLRALAAEARGDLPAAMALLETAHASDSRMALPALLFAYWGDSGFDQSERLRWREARDERLGALADSRLDLLARFCDADNDNDWEATLRYAQALLELRPQAWYLRLARAHLLNLRGSRPAALRELQQIQPTSLGHRKLADAIADRASMGDLAGARAAVAALAQDPTDPHQARLAARLAYSAGDLRTARDRFLDAAQLSHAAGVYSAEARAWLWAGLFSASLGESAAAVEQLRRARVTLNDGGQLRYAFDTNIALAQLHGLAADRQVMSEALNVAGSIAERLADPMTSALYQLAAARLDDRPLQLSAEQSASDTPWDQLLRVRLAIDAGEHEHARALLQRALDEGIAGSILVEEVALLSTELGMAMPALRPIDPPFGPYTRFAARWALGMGISVVPPRSD